MDNKIEMYKEMVLKGEKLEKEQAMSVTELCEKAVKYLFKALKLIISQIPGLIKGDIDIGWGK